METGEILNFIPQMIVHVTKIWKSIKEIKLLLLIGLIRKEIQNKELKSPDLKIHEPKPQGSFLQFILDFFWSVCVCLNFDGPMFSDSLSL